MNISKKLAQSASKSSDCFTSFAPELSRHIRYFDKESCELIGQKSLTSVNENYLRKIFGLQNDNPMLFSYPVKLKQKAFIERVTGLHINLESYQYFMECDFKSINI